MKKCSRFFHEYCCCPVHGIYGGIIVMWWGLQATGQLARKGALVDVSALIKTSDSVNRQTVSTKPGKLCTWKNSLYAVPIDMNNLELHYNKTHFGDTGIDPGSISRALTPPWETTPAEGALRGL